MWLLSRRTTAQTPRKPAPLMFWFNHSWYFPTQPSWKTPPDGARVYFNHTDWSDGTITLVLQWRFEESTHHKYQASAAENWPLHEDASTQTPTNWSLQATHLSSQHPKYNLFPQLAAQQNITRFLKGFHPKVVDYFCWWYFRQPCQFDSWQDASKETASRKSVCLVWLPKPAIFAKWCQIVPAHVLGNERGETVVANAKIQHLHTTAATAECIEAAWLHESWDRFSVTRDKIAPSTLSTPAWLSITTHELCQQGMPEGCNQLF